MYDGFPIMFRSSYLWGFWQLFLPDESTGRRRMIYQTMLGPVQLDVLCETEDPPPLKTHEETEDTTLSVPENAVVKRPGALQHGGEVDPEDEDEDGPEVEVMEIGPLFGDDE